MLRFFLFGLALPLSCALGAAEPPARCPTTKQIQEKYGRSCHENVVFSQAASVCFRRLEERQLLLQAELSTQLASQMSAADSQAGALQAQTSALSRISLSLSALEKEALETQEEFRRYSSSFALPAGLKAEEAKALGLGEFFAGFPCYSQNQASLGNTMISMKEQIEQIAKAKSSTEELQRRTAAASSAFRPSAGGPVLVKGVGGGAAPTANAPVAPRSGASDITGTQKKKD